PLERQRFNAGLLRPFEDRVRIGDRIRDPRLSRRDLEDPPRGTCKIQSPSEVPGGLRLFCPFEEAPRERGVGRIAARGRAVLPGPVAKSFSSRAVFGTTSGGPAKGAFGGISVWRRGAVGRSSAWRSSMGTGSRSATSPGKRRTPSSSGKAREAGCASAVGM